MLVYHNTPTSSRMLMIDDQRAFLGRILPSVVARAIGHDAQRGRRVVPAGMADAFDEDDDAPRWMKRRASTRVCVAGGIQQSARVGGLLSPGPPIRTRSATACAEAGAREAPSASVAGPAAYARAAPRARKTTELAVPADWLRRGGARTSRRRPFRRRRGSELGRPPRLLRASSSGASGSADTKTTAIAKTPDVARGSPFVLAHSFADASFPGRALSGEARAASGLASRRPRAADLRSASRFLSGAAAASWSSWRVRVRAVRAVRGRGRGPPRPIRGETRGALFDKAKRVKKVAQTLDAALDAHLDASPRLTRISWICAHTRGSRSHPRRAFRAASRGRLTAKASPPGDAEGASAFSRRALSSPAARVEECTDAPRRSSRRVSCWRPCRRRRSRRRPLRDTTRGRQRQEAPTVREG